MKTCLTCADTGCPDKGTSKLSCDDWTSKGEEEPPEPHSAIADLRAEVEGLSHRFDAFQRAAADFIHALTEE